MLKNVFSHFKIIDTKPGRCRRQINSLRSSRRRVMSVSSVCMNLPDNNIIVIDPRAEGLVGQDAAVAHDDASFTAETARPESHMLVTQTT